MVVSFAVVKTEEGVPSEKLTVYVIGTSLERMSIEKGDGRHVLEPITVTDT